MDNLSLSTVLFTGLPPPPKYAAARRKRLYELTLRRLDLTDVYQRMALSLGRGATDPIVEHVDLLNTLCSRDQEAASRLIRIHLEDTLVELLKLFSLPE